MEKKKKFFYGGLITIFIVSMVANLYFVLDKAKLSKDATDTKGVLSVQDASKNKEQDSKVKNSTNSTPVAEQNSDKKIYQNIGPEPIFLESSKGNVKCIVLNFSSETALSEAQCSISPATKIQAACNGTSVLVYGDFKPGKTYTVRVYKGARNSKGGILENDAVAKVKISNLEPKINFATNDGFLPYSIDNIKIPFCSVNLDKATLEISKAYNNNLHVYNDLYYKQRYSMETLYTGEIKLKKVLDQEVYQELDLNKLLKNPTSGLYLIRLNDEELNVFVTDIGVQAVVDSNNSKVLVFLRSLTTNQPIAGAKVYVNSMKNQIVASGVTNADGSLLVNYRPDFNKKQDSISTITAIKGKDIVLMKLNRSEKYYSTTGKLFDKNNPNAFVFAERGVARPGEDIECFAYIKKISNNEPVAMKNLPFTLTLVNNYGEVIGRANVTSDNYGFVKSSFKVPASAPTGTYYLKCYLAGSSQYCGISSILIANYVPDMIKVSGKDLTSKEYLAAKEHQFSFAGNYYFGAPVTNTRCLVKVLTAPEKFPKFWGESWSVGCLRLSEKIPAFSKNIQKDENDVIFTYPGFTAKVYQPYKLIAQATMSQPGGRSVTGSVVKTVHPTEFYIGLREVDNKPNKTFEYTLLPAVEADYINLEQDLKIEFSLVEHKWDYALVKNGQKYSREWVKKSVQLKDKTRTVIIKKGKHFVKDIKQISWNLESGEYDLFAKSDCGKLISTKNFFYFYGESNERSMNPNVLTIKSNKKEVAPGESVQLQFESNVAGVACLAFFGTELEGKKIIPIEAGTNKVDISIPQNTHATSYYVGITTIGKTNRSLIRNFGVAQINVDQKKNHLLTVDIKLPNESRPNSLMPLAIFLKDAENKPQAGKVLLYAVDSGVTALTNYKAPNIFEHFYGKKLSTVNFYDLYSEIMADLKITPDGRIGGDAAIANKITKIKQSQCAKVLAKVIDVPSSGKAIVKLKLPTHTGALDVFAVAVSDNKVGSSQADVILREAISVKTAAPRFLAPKDISEISVTVFNHKLTSQNFSVKVNLPKAISIHRGDKTTFTGQNLAPGKQQTFKFRICSKNALAHGKIVTTFTMGKLTVTDEQFLTVRSPNVYQKFTEIKVVSPGETLTIDHQNLFVGKAKGSVKISNSLAISASSALDWLNQYPYGCLEQTCAAAFPYVSLDLLVKGKIITDEIATTNKHKVRHAANQIKAMALSDGSFAMWPGYKQSWVDSSIFAYHFLFEAINKKFILSQDVNLYKACSFLRKIAQDSSEQNRNLAAYAAYCLSLQGDNVAVSVARNIISRSTKYDFALFLAGATLIKSNYASLGTKVMLDAVKGKCYQEAKAPFNYSNEACRLGMMLYILIDSGLKDIPEVATMAYLLSQQVETSDNVWGTTQANAWGILGLAAFSSVNEMGDYSVEITTSKTDKKVKSNSLLKLTYNEPITIKNTSNKQVIIESILSGIPKEQKAKNNGVKITKEFLNQDGQVITSASFGELLTVRLTIDCKETIDNLVVADLLPGCFEIEDSLLATRAISVSSQLAKNYPNFNVKRFEKGDDVYLAFGDAFEGKTTFTYNVRVISKGRFFIPSTHAEAMYNARINGVSNSLGFFVVK